MVQQAVAQASQLWIGVLAKWLLQRRQQGCSLL